MKYQKPLVSDYAINIFAVSQYTAQIESVGFTIDGCPTFVYNGDLPQGNVSISSQFTLEAGSCVLNGSITASAFVDGQNITPDCENANLSCSLNANCSSAPGVEGQLCVTTLFVNGDPIDPLCVPIESQLADQVIQLAFSQCSVE
jgi:hypothetical protein